MPTAYHMCSHPHADPYPYRYAPHDHPHPDPYSMLFRVHVPVRCVHAKPVTTEVPWSEMMNQYREHYPTKDFRVDNAHGPSHHNVSMREPPYLVETKHLPSPKGYAHSKRTS